MGNVPSLPGGLYRPRVVVLAHVRHRFTSRYAVDHRDTCKSGAGSSVAAVARNLHPLRRRTAPSFVQRVLGIAGVRGQPEVRPPDPPRIPADRLWLPIEQVDPELGGEALGRGAAQSPAADESTGR